MDHLADLALDGRADWSRRLGLPHDALSDEAIVGARLVAAYRDRYGITGPDPLGDEPEHRRQVEDYRRASAALENLRTGLAVGLAPIAQLLACLGESVPRAMLATLVLGGTGAVDLSAEPFGRRRLLLPVSNATGWCRHVLLAVEADQPDNSHPRREGPRRNGPQL